MSTFNREFDHWRREKKYLSCQAKVIAQAIVRGKTFTWHTVALLKREHDLDEAERRKTLYITSRSRRKK